MYKESDRRHEHLGLKYGLAIQDEEEMCTAWQDLCRQQEEY